MDIFSGQVYVTKTVGKAVTALAFLVMGTKHLVDRDFDFSFHCDASHLRRTRYQGETYDKVMIHPLTTVFLYNISATG